ncbi:MAG: hypothetical protein GY816_02000 [Cytophagales bacterium]|nr:hypothetical protein [Cytophagales bacterium]
MSEDKSPSMVEHFDKLKAILPELYQPKEEIPATAADRLFTLLKNSLGVIEAVYLQSPENFSTARLDAYSSIVLELKDLGLNYRGNEEILNKAANQLIMQAKKPMEKAGMTKKEDLGREVG